MENMILITKDAMCCDYLPCYGNTMWNTPNINELADKGTLFTRYYTAAPSTVMSFFSAITGKYAHETPYQLYDTEKTIYEGDTLFSKLKTLGYESHIVWGDIWHILPKKYDCYRDDVSIHTLDNFRQGVGAHYIHDGFLDEDIDKQRNTFQMIEKTVREIIDGKNNVFLWLHFPHVINGKVCYGSDIELFDEYVGMLRKYFDDKNIYLSADHGNMNGHKGKVGYGFDTFETAIRIPLITPKIDGAGIVDGIISNTDLIDILVNKTIPKHSYVFSDTAYKAQKQRILAVIGERYKYVYHNIGKKEELYDLQYDPNEEFNLINNYIWDADRKIKAPSREYYYYPCWNDLDGIRKQYREQKDTVWENGDLKYIIMDYLVDVLRPIKGRMTRKKIKRSE